MPFQGGVTVVVGGQYGSEGKGAVVKHIADDYQMHVRTGGPNAGHTFYHEGVKCVTQSIPVGVICNPNAIGVIGAGAVVDIAQLYLEMLLYPSVVGRLFVDHKAFVITDDHRSREKQNSGDLRIGSTCKGVGESRVQRIRRGVGCVQPVGIEETCKDHGIEGLRFADTAEMIHMTIDSGFRVLLEGTQGTGLSLYHGAYPYVTSEDTTASGICAAAGVAPFDVTDVILVCRTFPIRVAGNSGPLPNETTWDKLHIDSGGYIKPEITTVSKKVRRVADFHLGDVKRAIRLNRATSMWLMFGDYIDTSLSFKHEPSDGRHLVNHPNLRHIMDSIDSDMPLVECIGTSPDTYIRVGPKRF